MFNNDFQFGVFLIVYVIVMMIVVGDVGKEEK